MACTEYHCNCCGNIQRTGGICCGQQMVSYFDEENSSERKVKEEEDKRSYRHYRDRW